MLWSRRKKLWRKTGALVLADDSGLEVDALNGEPGIYSARYMGHETSYHIKNKNLIERLEGKTGEERSARFVCAIAAWFSGWQSTDHQRNNGRTDWL